MGAQAVIFPFYFDELEWLVFPANEEIDFPAENRLSIV